MAELREWLEARGLGRYADALLAQDIELDILLQLTDADLTAAGLPVGARKRLLQWDSATCPTPLCRRGRSRSVRQRRRQLKQDYGYSCEVLLRYNGARISGG